MCDGMDSSWKTIFKGGKDGCGNGGCRCEYQYSD